MTITLRPVFGFVFAALLALSLIATTQDAIAKTSGTNAVPALFDEGLVESLRNLPRPLGRLGVAWE